MKTTVTLSVSSPRMDCFALALRLRGLGISCDLSENLTVLNGELERGCRVVSTVEDPGQVKKIWEAVRSGHPEVKCGHMQIAGQYSGCTSNYPFVDECPGRTGAPSE